MTTLFQDLRFGARLLRRQPGFTLVAILVLTVGIGVNTAAFSFVNALLLKPRTGKIDHELVGVYSRHRQRPDDYRAFSWADYTWLRDRRDLFRSLTAHGFGLAGLKEGDVTRRVFADIVSANYFETFGVTLPLGRTFTEQEERPGADIPVLILSYGAWARLGAPTDIVGRQVEVNLRAFTVVGVAPQGFGGSLVLATPEIWVPTGMYETMAFEIRNEGRTVSLANPEFRELILVGRLQPGSGIASLATPLANISRLMADDHPAASKDYELQLAPLSRLSVSTRPQVDDQLTGVAAMLLSLAGVVTLHRVVQSGQHAARSRPRAPNGARDSIGYRRQPVPTCPPTAHRERASGAHRRRGRGAAVLVDHAVRLCNGARDPADFAGVRFDS